jgi:hypothetical protein
MGKSHCDEHAPCANHGLDDYTLAPFCMVQKIRDLEAQRDENQWLSSMLEHFWRNGIGSEGFEFLKKTNFITSYRFVRPCLNLSYGNNAYANLSTQYSERGNLSRCRASVWQNCLWLRARRRMANSLPALSCSSKPGCQHMCHGSWLAVWGKHGSWTDRRNLRNHCNSNPSGCLDLSQCSAVKL